MHRSSTIRILLAVGIAVCLAGCAGIGRRLTDEGTLRERQDNYTRYVKFGQFEKASTYVVPELQSAFRTLTDDFGDLRMTDYWVEELDLDPARRAARIVVRFRGYWLSRPVEEMFEVVQHWELGAAEEWLVRPDVEKLRQLVKGRVPESGA